MPIYEYKCPKCGVVEMIQGIKQAPLKKCPNCNSKVERMISATSFVLKGSGWYATDYAKKSTPAEPSHESNGSTAPDGASASGTDGSASKTGEKSGATSDSKGASSDSKAVSSDSKSSGSSDKSASATKPAAAKSSD